MVTSIKWIDLSTHRAGLPRLPSNLPLTDLVNPYRDYDSKKAAAFLNQYELPRQPGKSQEYSNLGVSVLGYLVAAEGRQVLRTVAAGTNRGAAANDRLHRFTKQRSDETTRHAA